jgi:hypothetical protein
MPIQGDLRTMTVPEILMWVSQFQKTGTLEIRSGGISFKLAFEKGILTFSSSSDRKTTLGRLLIERGVLTEEMHRKARTIRKEKSVAIGKALRELDLMSEEELMRFLRKKAENEVFQVLEKEEGEFTFDEKDLPSIDLLPLRLDVANLLLRVVQQKDEAGEYDFDSTISGKIPQDL